MKTDGIALPLLVASHDAGGAEVLAAWLKAHFFNEALSFSEQHKVTFVLQGPAKNVYLRYFPELHYVDVPPTDLSAYNTVLTSTSGETSALERGLIKQAKAQGVYCIAALDYWKNYRLRFEHESGIILPDALWVFDPWAKALAEEAFPGLQIEQQPNAYLNAQVEAIGSVSDAKEMRVLYVCEPSYDPRYTEFDAMNLAVSWLVSTAEVPIALRLRMHPREPGNKYDAFIDACAAIAGIVRVEKSQQSLAEDLTWSSTVIGCQTAAMVVALYAGRKVYSAMPASVEEAIALPHEGIQRLSNMVDQ